jgi:uncharacterized protein
MKPSLQKTKLRLNWILIILTVISLVLLVMQQSKYIGKKYALIKGQMLELDVANSPETRQKGLGGRASMPTNRGMLFIFDYPEKWEFWMGDMKFALDFIWVQDNEVADITENVLPPHMTNDTPVFLRPATAVQYVIETNSGWVKNHGITIGDEVEIHL